jgi:hypothetical protein
VNLCIKHSRGSQQWRFYKASFVPGQCKPFQQFLISICD